MGTLIKFELKKLYKSRLNQIVFLGTCFIMLVAMLLSVEQMFTYDKEGNTVSGLEWADYKKEIMKEQEGPLTDERAEEIIREYQELISNPDNVEGEGASLHFKKELFYSYELPMQDLLLKVAHNYDEPGINTWGGNLIELSLEERKEFYKARTERLRDTLIMGTSDWEYSDAEQRFWEKRAEEIATPVYYGYTEGWKQVIDCIGFFILPLVGLCIMLARIYAGEYESGAEHIILTTKYGKTKVIAAKTLAALIFGGLYCLINAGIPYAVILSAFGAEGGRLSIQNYDMQNPYPFTCAQMALLYSGICLAAAFGITAFVLFLSSRMKAALPVLSTSMVVILSGIFMRYSETHGIYNRIIDLLPYKAISVFSINGINSYPFGNLVLDYPSMLYVVYLTLGILLLFFAGRAFRKHEVE